MVVVPYVYGVAAIPAKIPSVLALLVVGANVPPQKTPVEAAPGETVGVDLNPARLLVVEFRVGFK